MSETSEDLLLKCLEQNPPDMDSLAGPLTDQYHSDSDSVELQIRVLKESLVEKNALRAIVELYSIMADWHATNRPWRKTAVQELSKLLGEDPLFAMYLDLCQLNSPRVKVKEALRRLVLMADLAPGTYVYEKQWGFGVVKEVRHDEKRVVVDFATKPAHDMVFGFAAEILRTIGDDHLFARKQLDSETFEQLIKDDPAEIVRMALRSFGSLTAPRVQSILVPEIVPEARWKTFWANARKGLKQDPLVVIPAKRSEAIELLSQEKSFDAAWFRDLATTRSMEHVLERIEELLEAGGEAVVVDDARETVFNRLKFTVKGAEGKHHDYCVRSWLIGLRLGMEPEEIDLTDFLERVRTSEGLLAVVQCLSAKLTKSFFAALAELDETATVEALLLVLPRLEYSALNEAISLLLDRGLEDRVAAVLREGWNQWESEVDVMYWLSMNRKKVEEWNYGTTPELVARLLKALNRDYTGARLRVQNQLREIFRQPEWLRGVIDSMDVQQRRAFTQGVKDSSAWEQLDKASVLGQIIKIDGSVQDIVSGRSDDADANRDQPKVTSFRSFHAREAALEKLITKDIPENSKEIAVARSYGDLRENFEYKAAKDTQRLLMQRQSEMESQLRVVKPTDFSEFSSDVAGIATNVTLEFAEGGQVAYSLLGEWDSDAAKNILSSGSALAKSVMGHGVGDEVVIPGEDGPVSATITAVTPVDADLLAWLSQTD